MKNVILDARINMADDKDEVPQEGKFSIGNEKNTVTFENVKGDDYVLSMARLGERINMGKFEFRIK